MKIKMKMIAAAVAMVATGAANAAFVAGNVGTGNGTLGLFAWDTVTNSFYLRDLGFTMNTFLPNSGATITPTGETGATFDKTPEAGLTINSNGSGGATAQANFADASFASWLATVTPGNVRWLVAASDSAGTTVTNRVRQIGSIATGATFATPSNGTIGNGTGNINGFGNAAPGISTTGTLGAAQITAIGAAFINQGTLGALAAVLDGTANLYYWTRTTGTGSIATTANSQAFGNGSGLAVLSLASNGDFTYTLAGDVAPVPLPAAAWLMGAGLLALGGAARRKKALAAA